VLSRVIASTTAPSVAGALASNSMNSLILLLLADSDS
jgi:hypothetical protein